ncbi:hypothetical protein J2S74_001831 [Evansella vedderi]|uniref:Uncharacterized protein n=1 Tax=Evansella vedderi TaxID=38282 RepID=A0ABT9ZT94_9BACI|nr:hypothetical protein [Evansella vedderi]MDQ0254452.1 hypothetical protein [Evansella vedderi]
MGIEDFKKIMIEIKDYSEKEPEVDTEKILSYIQEKLSRQFDIKED